MADWLLERYNRDIQALANRIQIIVATARQMLREVGRPVVVPPEIYLYLTFGADPTVHSDSIRRWERREEAWRRVSAGVFRMMDDVSNENDDLIRADPRGVFAQSITVQMWYAYQMAEEAVILATKGKRTEARRVKEQVELRKLLENKKRERWEMANYEE